MSNAIKITKGLDLNLYGAPMPEVVETFVSEYALKPKDFIGLIPKLMIEEGERVKAGTPLFYAKGKEKVLFTSPVSGVVKQVKRGAKRVIEEVIISAEETVEYLDFGVSNISELSAEQIKEKLLVSGAWTLLRQRPYSVVPSPDTTPKCIIVSGFSSAPLAPDYSVLLKGLNKELQAGIDVLKKMTGVTIHVNLPAKTGRADELAQLQNAQINTFEGKHPCGNVSVQIEKLDPINKSERVWYLDAQDLVAIGRLFLEGKYDTTRLVALTGQEVSHPQYYKVKRGASIASMIYNNTTAVELRLISGNVLSGTKIEKDGFVSAYDNQVTVIKEGNEAEFMGWLAPGVKKFSFSRTFLAGFLTNCGNRKYKVDTNLHGGRRPFVVTGEFEKVFPMDIYPMQLIKACIIEDIDMMEQLGIYEVDPEDFALCELIDSSKTDIQEIISKGLELMRKEMGE